MKFSKIVVLTIICNIFIGMPVNAASSYSMTLNTTTQEVVKDSIVEIYVTLDNINEIPDGINACMFNLEYDSTKIEIIKNNNKSLIGQNGWDGDEGQNIVWEKTSGSSSTKTNIGKISAKILDNSSITIKNIECSDGNEDLYALNNTINFTIKQEQIENNDNNQNNNITNNESSNDYNSSDNTDNPQTGLKELSITFLLIAILGIVIKKIISKKDLFKKI